MKADVVLHRSFQPGRICFDLPDDEAMTELIRQVLRSCKDKYGDFVRVTLQKPYQKRTQGKHSQNSAIHGFCQQIAMATGNDLETVKLVAKTRAMSRGYPAKVDRNGNVIMNLFTREPEPESSADVNTVEAGYVIDALQQLAAELGIRLVEE